MLINSVRDLPRDLKRQAQRPRRRTVLHCERYIHPSGFKFLYPSNQRFPLSVEEATLLIDLHLN